MATVKGYTRKVAFAIISIAIVGGIKVTAYRHMKSQFETPTVPVRTATISDISYVPGPTDYHPGPETLAEMKAILSTTVAADHK